MPCIGPDSTSLSADFRAGVTFRFGAAFFLLVAAVFLPLALVFFLLAAVFLLLADFLRAAGFFAVTFFRLAAFFEGAFFEDAFFLLTFFLLTFFLGAFLDADFFLADLPAVDFFFVDFLAADFFRVADFLLDFAFFLLTGAFFLAETFLRPDAFLEATFLRVLPAFLRCLLAAFLAGIVDSCRFEKNAGLYIGCGHMEAQFRRHFSGILAPLRTPRSRALRRASRHFDAALRGRYRHA